MVETKAEKKQEPIHLKSTTCTMGCSDCLSLFLKHLFHIGPECPLSLCLPASCLKTISSSQLLPLPVKRGPPGCRRMCDTVWNLLELIFSSQPIQYPFKSHYPTKDIVNFTSSPASFQPRFPPPRLVLNPRRVVSRRGPCAAHNMPLPAKS